MTTRVKVLVETKYLEDTQTTQYTATNLTARIDTFNATNVSGSPVSFVIHIVPSGDTASNENLQVGKTLQSGESYSFPELVNQVLASGDFISGFAGTASAINIRVCGREIT